MAKSKTTRPSEVLSLTIDGSQITAERFVKGVSSFVGLINDVAEVVAGRRGAINWR